MKLSVSHQTPFTRALRFVCCCFFQNNTIQEKIAIFEFIQEKQDTIDLHRIHVIYIIAFNTYQNEIPLLLDDILRT